jgi:DNA-binding winged helix-turn-helix (wHTH) protein
MARKEFEHKSQVEALNRELRASNEGISRLKRVDIATVSREGTSFTAENMH